VTAGITGSQQASTVTPAAASTLEGGASLSDYGVLGGITVTGDGPRIPLTATRHGYTCTVHLTSIVQADSFPGPTHPLTNYGAGSCQLKPEDAGISRDGQQAPPRHGDCRIHRAARRAIIPLPSRGESRWCGRLPLAAYGGGLARHRHVDAKDSLRNTATGYTGTVTFTSSDWSRPCSANSKTLTNGGRLLAPNLEEQPGSSR